jgi:hypothetical protein
MDCIEAYRQASNDDLLTQEMAEQLGNHLLAAETPSVTELRSQTLTYVMRQIRTLLGQQESPSPAFKALLAAADEYSIDDGDGRQPAPSYESEEIEHFSIGLGRFDIEQALATLDDQQDFLLAFARSAPKGSRVSFRLDTAQDPAFGEVSAHFSICALGPNDPESAAYFGSLQRIVRSIFLRGWEVYSRSPYKVSGHTVEILPESGVAPKIREDLGLLVDVLRASEGNCRLEIEGIADPSQRANVLGQSLPDIAGDAEGGTIWFSEQPASTAALGLRIRLTTPVPNDALANLVGSVLFGGGTFLISDGPQRTLGEPETFYPVEVAHRILHPPHGYIEGRGLSRQRPLFLPLREVPRDQEGAVLGSASVARPYVDDQVEVCIPDSSRILHTYIIGRTGVGKTNTLKNIARHDVTSGAPVILIDPHGDLYDYVVKHAAVRDSLVALDFSTESGLSLNPLYLDAVDEGDILRNLDELVEIFIHSSYYEWAGPRFGDLLRLCLETLVAVANEREGVWATVSDVPRLIEDKEFRGSIKRSLQLLKRDDLSRRWSIHESMTVTEQAEVEQWFVSKFGDLRKSAVWVQTVSGKPSVAVKQVLAGGGVLLIKIPGVALGQGVSRFLGSFIIERVLRYTMDGIFVNRSAYASIIVDEFQNFVGSSFARLIPEARKFKLGITIANQTLVQLSGFNRYEGRFSDNLAQVILGNVGNLIVQGIGRHDAEILASELHIGADDAARIGKYSAAVLLTVNGERLEPFTVDLNSADEVPGVMAGSVALTHVEEALRRAGASVGLPDLKRTQVDPGQVATPEPPTRGSHFLDEWLDTKRRRLVQERDESSAVDSSSGDGRVGPGVDGDDAGWIY